MIQKAIIEMASSPTTYKIRIPEVDGVRGFIQSTLSDDLPEATICSPPNAIPNYIEGDVVFVAYEVGETPVILGKLFTTKDDNTFQDVKLNNLSVNGEISIGDTSRSDLLNLSSTRGNIQEQIDAVNSLIGAIDLINAPAIQNLLQQISGYDSTKTQTLKNNNGTIRWVDD